MDCSASFCHSTLSQSDIATSAHHSAALCSATHVYSKTCSLLRSTGVLARSAPLTSCHNVLC